ncbi:MAG: PQQ-like beta-propeller repeat protein [Sedimentisphaerales bacterium]|nr:PQQ-like beta-propeller repeat protein [Sedimentisphaerales bacterium]
MKKTGLGILALVVTLVPFQMAAYGNLPPEVWPTWRGPLMSGISPQGDPPLTWSETDNILWKVKLAGDGSNSSPIVWGDKIFFQTAQETDKQATAGAAAPAGGSDGRRRFGSRAPTHIHTFHLICLDRQTGKQLWEKTVCEILPHQGHHADHGFASFSPVTDGEFIWAHFGSRGVYCYDLDGRQQWKRDLGQLNIRAGFGEGGSVALADDKLMVLMDHEGDSFLVALDKKTGEPVWKQDRDEPTSWTTPLVVQVDGQMQVIVNGSNRTRGYHAQTGQELWQCGGQTENVVPTPVTGFDMVFCTSGFRGSALQAIRLGQRGDLTGSDAVAWQVNEATPYVPSPLLYGEKVYVCATNNGVISCYNAKTGKPYYVKRTLEQIKGIYASPVGAAGRVYLVGRNGVTYVLDNTKDWEILAVNTLDDHIDCSPAIIGETMYLKGKEYLYCIGEAK